MKKLLMLCMIIPLLSGCWDEVLYKDLTIVPVMGIEGVNNDITMYFSFPVFDEESMEYHVTTGKGISVRTARNDAFLHSSEMLDISQVEMFLIDENTAKEDIYHYIDSIYRTPRNRLNGHMVLTTGDMKDFFKVENELPTDPADFYKGLLETTIKFSKAPDLNFQNAIRIYFEQGQDLALPMMSISEETNTPEITGAGLFSKHQFTGHRLNITQTKLMNLLNENANVKYLQFEYEWEKGEQVYPLVAEFVSKKEHREIKNGKIHHTIDLKVAVEEFPHDHLSDKKFVKQLDQFLAEKITEDLYDMMDTLQEAKSDVIGYGKTVRAFHQDLWNRGEWQDTFSTLDIELKVSIDIVRTGILG